jgi:hypothetical protein
MLIFLLEKKMLSFELSAAGKNMMLAELASFWMQSFRKGYTGSSD